MKHNLQVLNNVYTIYINSHFNILLNILNYKILYLLLNCYKINLIVNSVVNLNYNLLNNVWHRRININKKLVLNQQLGNKLIITTNHIPAVHVTHAYIISSNYSPLSCVNILKIFNIKLNLQLLTFFSNYYYKSILKFNNYSLLLTYYLINNCNISILTNKPLNTNKSLFIINIKKL